jgi:hypothetical protein
MMKFKCGTGTEIMDQAYYYYNAQGKIVKVQSCYPIL